MSSFATFWVPHPAEGTPAAETVRVEQVAALVRQTGVLSATGIVNACLMLAVLWPGVHPVAAALWWAVLTLPAAYRLLRWYRNRRRTKPSRVSPAVLRRATWLAASVGVSWGSAAVLLYRGGEELGAMFLFVTLVATAGIGAISLASVPVAAFWLAAPMLLPLLARFALDGSGMLLAMSGIGLLFLVALFSFVRTVHGSFMETVGARIAHSDVMGEL